jgi:hypothetical protein
MLQINEGRAPAFDGVDDQREPKHASIVDLGVLFLRRRYVLILCSVVMALPLGVLYLKFAPPKYVAVASISVDNRESQSPFVQQQATWSDATVDVDSEIMFLKIRRRRRNCRKAASLGRRRRVCWTGQWTVFYAPSPLDAAGSIWIGRWTAQCAPRALDVVAGA